MWFHKLKKGFTLIELLVVIAIISLLSTIVMAALNNSRIKARDTQRVAQIKELQKAIEAYTSDHGYPPICTLSKNNNQTWCGSCDASEAIINFNAALQPLVNEKYISKIPLDPNITGNCMAYEYYTLPNTGYVSGNNWYCKDSTNNYQYLMDYSYAIRFSTEKNKFSGFLTFMWNRTPGSNGQEYCVLGQKIR